MAGTNGYTPTQWRILQVLSDGRRHTREELHACLSDDLAALSAVQYHLSKLRNDHLLRRGEDIVCVVHSRKFWYQHVRLLPSANDGRT